MYQNIQELAQKLSGQFDQIPEARKAILAKIAAYIRQKRGQNEPVKLVFICTHNSRRSHFGQVAAAVAADFYGVEAVQVFSGGTEATAFHPNAIRALRNLGFRVTSGDETVKNPVWSVEFGENRSTTCFSKTFDDAANPAAGFAAIMTCSDAEQNCPFVPGTELRIGTTYQDPKSSDGTPEQDETYRERFEQIATEMLYVFSLST
jgi:protein-tyrosine phosphatase/arsenate reductase